MKFAWTTTGKILSYSDENYRFHEPADASDRNNAVTGYATREEAESDLKVFKDSKCKSLSAFFKREAGND
jgi:hypothetical protein